MKTLSHCCKITADRVIAVQLNCLHRRCREQDTRYETAYDLADLTTIDSCDLPCFRICLIHCSPKPAKTLLLMKLQHSKATAIIILSILRLFLVAGCWALIQRVNHQHNKLLR